MRAGPLAEVRNAGSVPLSRLAPVAFGSFRAAVEQALSAGGWLSALFARPVTPAGGRGARGSEFLLTAVLQHPGTGTLGVACTRVAGDWPSLTPSCPAAHLFEREIAETWNIHPQGHPWLKPVRFAAPRPGAAPGAAGPAACGEMEYYRVEGEEVHEVAVGPVHAGVIEPGHFRFQCHGETVLHLEISLGYQHRGAEERLRELPPQRGAHLCETLAGDTSVGHAIAYCQAIEALSGCTVPARGQALRAVALELERAANHVGDLGALAGDVGYLPTSSWCGRIRGDILNMTGLLCGSRFGRGFVRPGGTGFDCDEALAGMIRERLASAARDAADACGLLWKTPSVIARFEGTGTLPEAAAREIGLVGPAARASGIDRDVRRDLPTGIYAFAHIPVCTWQTGDVFARAQVRWLEVQRSLAFIDGQLRSLPSGEVRAAVGRLAPRGLAVSLVEGWRGEICHVAVCDSSGRLGACKVVDPSFHNWLGLALAMRGGDVSDFPLCNKSFNLSYCGHDL
jgi:Ni,Fe-hydrogenase III large subunit